MKLITRDTDYALRAICYIACSKTKLVSAAELFKSLKIPRPFLRKILQELDKKGILKSYKGKGGGFKLAVNPRGIYLLDIMNIFQRPVELNECLFKKMACPNIKICLLRRKIEDIEDHVLHRLKSITVSSLLR